MEKLIFKTNINCSGCIAKVSPFLSNKDGIENWTVDTNSPDKILTVEACELTPEEIEDTVRQSGFRIELLDQQTEVSPNNA